MLLIRVEPVERYTPDVSYLQILHSMHNYHTLMGFIAAFNIAAIQRLKHSKALLKKKTLAVRLVDCSSSVLLNCCAGAARTRGVDEPVLIVGHVSARGGQCTPALRSLYVRLGPRKKDAYIGRER